METQVAEDYAKSDQRSINVNGTLIYDIVQTLSTRARLLVFSRAFWMSMLVADAVALSLLLLHQNAIRQSVWFVAAAFGAPFALSLARTIIFARASVSFARIADSKLNLNDRLATSYELQKSGSQSPFTLLIIEDTVRSLKGANLSQAIDPRRDGACVIGTIILLIILVGWPFKAISDLRPSIFVEHHSVKMTAKQFRNLSKAPQIPGLKPTIVQPVTIKPTPRTNSAENPRQNQMNNVPTDKNQTPSKNSQQPNDNINRRGSPETNSDRQNHADNHGLPSSKSVSNSSNAPGTQSQSQTASSEHNRGQSQNSSSSAANNSSKPNDNHNPSQSPSNQSASSLSSSEHQESSSTSDRHQASSPSSGGQQEPSGASNGHQQNQSTSGQPSQGGSAHNSEPSGNQSNSNSQGRGHGTNGQTGQTGRSGSPGNKSGQQGNSNFSQNGSGNSRSRNNSLSNRPSPLGHGGVGGGGPLQNEHQPDGSPISQSRPNTAKYSFRLPKPTSEGKILTEQAGKSGSHSPDSPSRVTLGNSNVSYASVKDQSESRKVQIPAGYRQLLRRYFNTENSSKAAAQGH